MSTRTEWLEARQRGLGGSDAGAAVGVCPWKTRYQLYRDKVEPVVDDEPSEAMRWGTILEPVIRQRYCEVTKSEVAVPQATLSHPKYGWCLSNVDGITDANRLLEIKNSNAFAASEWGPSGSNELPQQYECQVQHYLAVTGLEVADVAVLIGGSDFRILTVEADRELQEMLLEREHDFWFEHVMKRVPPDPETEDDLKTEFPRSRGNLVEVDDETADLVRELAALKTQLKTMEARKDDMAIAIKRAIGDADGIEHDGKVLATWKSAKPSRSFDKQAFEAEHPHLAWKFTKERPGSRRFLVK